MIPTIRSAIDGLLHLTVPDIASAIAAGYTKIVVVQDTSESGSFSTQTGTATLAAATTGYTLYDQDGTSALYYKAKLSDADGTTVTALSEARQYGTSEAYCTAFDVRMELAAASGQASLDAKHDHVLWEMCREVSRLIDRYKDVEDGAYLASGSEARYFDGTGDAHLWLDDSPAVSISAVAVEETDGTYTAWASTDYYTWPYNGTPIRRLDINPKSDGSKGAWVAGPKRVKLTGVWGISTAVPYLVARASKVQTAMLYKRGMQGWSEMGGPVPMGVLTYPRELDPEVKGMLKLVEPRKVLL